MWKCQAECDQPKNAYLRWDIIRICQNMSCKKYQKVPTLVLCYTLLHSFKNGLDSIVICIYLKGHPRHHISALEKKTHMEMDQTLVSANQKTTKGFWFMFRSGCSQVCIAISWNDPCRHIPPTGRVLNGLGISRLGQDLEPGWWRILLSLKCCG